MTTAAFVLAVGSTFAMLAHGILLRVGQAWYGGPYLVAAVLLGFASYETMAVKSARRRLRHEARHEA